METNDTETGGGGGGGSETDEGQEEETVTAAGLSTARLVRRLSLDLTGRLPARSDVEAIREAKSKLLQGDDGEEENTDEDSQDESQKDEDDSNEEPDVAPPEVVRAFYELIPAYLESGTTSRTLARMHTEIWGLADAPLPEIAYFAENSGTSGNEDLSGGLTDSLRREIRREPVHLLRYILDERHRFSALFDGAYTVVHKDVLGVWNLEEDGSPWPGEPYRFGLYKDSRPAAGVLATNGLLAAFSDDGATIPRHRARRILERLACLDLDSPRAHRFYNMKQKRLAGDLTSYASENAPCASCHRQFEGPGKGMKGLGQGNTLKAWRTYDKNAALTNTTLYYAGRGFKGLGGLGNRLAKDPRVHRCEITHLMSELYQRPLFRHDASTAATSLRGFYDEGQSLRSAVQEIVRGSTYVYAPVKPKLKDTLAKQTSGVKLLARRHWRGILNQLSPSTAGMEIPQGLEPGGDEAKGGEFHIPSGTYWHHANITAREVAERIVAAELSDSSEISARTVLTHLPAGSGADASMKTVGKQIKALWQDLTTDKLKESDTLYSRFVKLWKEARGSEVTADSVRRAWRSLLVGMLLHPRFLTY